MAFEPKGQKGECQCRSAGGDGAYPIYRHVLGPCLRLVEIAFLTPSEKVGAEQEQGEDESDAADYPQELHYHVTVQCFHSRRISSLTALQLFGVCRVGKHPDHVGGRGIDRRVEISGLHVGHHVFLYYARGHGVGHRTFYAVSGLDAGFSGTG